MHPLTSFMRDDAPLVTIGILFCSTFGMIGALTWLYGQLDWLGQHGLDPGSPPETNSGRSGAYSLLGWVWTNRHRTLANRAAARAVLLSRVFAVISLGSMALLIWLGRVA